MVTRCSPVRSSRSRSSTYILLQIESSLGINIKSRWGFLVWVIRPPVTQSVRSRRSILREKKQTNKQGNGNSTVEWNVLDTTKEQGTGKMCSPQRGFVISRSFFIHFVFTLGKKKSFVIRRASSRS